MEGEEGEREREGKRKRGREENWPIGLSHQLFLNCIFRHSENAVCGSDSSVGLHGSMSPKMTVENGVGRQSEAYTLAKPHVLFCCHRRLQIGQLVEKRVYLSSHFQRNKSLSWWAAWQAWQQGSEAESSHLQILAQNRENKLDVKETLSSKA